MILYHGSNVDVVRPELRQASRPLDFGTGFYLTSDWAQASRWAKTKVRRTGRGHARVSLFKVEEAEFGALNVLVFPDPSHDWLEYVGRNRRGHPETQDIDVVVGPVANDTTMPVLKLFFGGIYTEDEAIRRLLPQNLKDQYAFKTQRAIEALMPLEVRDA